MSHRSVSFFITHSFSLFHPYLGYYTTLYISPHFCPLTNTSRFTRQITYKGNQHTTMKVSESGYTSEKEAHLTVCKTSLFFANDGFTVYDCHGQLVFRVDSYGPDWRDQDELVLMDASGHCLLTVRRKRPSLHNRWEGFPAERTEGSKPTFSVKRSSIIGRSGVSVETYQNANEEYQIEGSFAQRFCTIYDNATKEVMAEIRRKVDASSNVVLGKDVFSLLIKPGFDAAFAMGLVLVLDKISTDGLVDAIAGISSGSDSDASSNGNGVDSNSTSPTRATKM